MTQLGVRLTLPALMLTQFVSVGFNEETALHVPRTSHRNNFYGEHGKVTTR